MPSKIVKGALSALRKEPEEKKMLQGFYRGFAGTPEKGETVYHAGAKFHDAPRPGTFTTPDKDAALKYGKATGAKALHEFKALPRRSGSDADVIRAAKMHGVYEPGVPVGQYLEQGENAVFDASGEIVQTLRDFGYDSLRLHDAMSEAPSLVVLDPSIVKRPADTFVTPQKRVADYYAQKRAGQTGQEPHAEMVLADPFAGRAYGHSTPGTGATEPLTTKARKLRDSDIVDRTPLYQAGGLVKGGLKTLDNLVMKATKGRTAAKDVFASDFQTIPEKELMRMNSIEREQRVPMQSIVPTQPDVKTETALEYMMSNRVRDTGTKKMPEVVKWGDKYYIMDGHHRVAGQLALDRADIPVQVIGEIPAMKKANGGLVAAFKDGGAATGFFPQMKPQRAGHSGAGERMTEEALKFFIPQDTTDLALMAFPFGKAGKAAAAGLLALTPAESEAGKLKTGVDLARRSFFGLKPSQDMAGRELVSVQKDLDRMQAELAKAEKVAPKVEQKTTTVTPSPTAPKIEQTVKSIAETPVSRRTVLKSAAGQAIQGALPASSFADLMKPATVAKQAVQAMAPAAAVTASSVPALMAKAVKMGMDSDEALAFVKRELGESAETVMAKQDPELLYDTLKDPFESIVDDPEWLYKFKNGKQDRLMGPGELLQVQLGQGETPGPLKETLRGLKAEMSPEDYANMKNAMKDAINQEIKYGGDY